MSKVYLVRHGQAAAGWNIDPDPGLDEVGMAQAVEVAALMAPLGPLRLVTSPLRRCRETAAALAAEWGIEASVDPRVAEIPSPEGIAMADRVEWLREAMRGDWSALGERYTDYRDDVFAAVRAFADSDGDTVVCSHFVAINAVIGAALADDRLLIRSLDNCSVTVFDLIDGSLQVIEDGREADTLIR